MQRIRIQMDISELLASVFNRLQVHQARVSESKAEHVPWLLICLYDYKEQF